MNHKIEAWWKSNICSNLANLICTRQSHIKTHQCAGSDTRQSYQIASMCRFWQKIFTTKKMSNSSNFYKTIILCIIKSKLDGRVTFVLADKICTRQSYQNFFTTKKLSNSSNFYQKITYSMMRSNVLINDNYAQSICWHKICFNVRFSSYSKCFNWQERAFYGKTFPRALV